MGAVACNTKPQHIPPDKHAEFKLPQEKIASLSYGLINEKIFKNKCIYCHDNSKKIGLENYADVVKNLKGIKTSVFDEKSMPKKGLLTNEELSTLWNWIQLGAPKFAKDGSPVVSPEPILATYDSINKNVFQTSCKDCHNPKESGKRVLLDKESLLNSPLELIIPGNADESGLTLAIERIDNKRMPPAKDGYAIVSDEAKLAIRKWIENGAKD